MSFHGPLPYQYRFPNQEFLYPALPQAETSLDPPSVSSLALNDLPPHQGHPVPVNPYYTQSRVRCIQPYMALDRPVPATPPAPRRRLSRATFAELAATQPLSWLHEVAQNRTRDEIADQINELVGSENELCEYQRRHPELPHLSEQLGMLEAAEAGNEMALFGAGSGSGSGSGPGSGPVVLAPIHEETKLPYPTPRIRIGDSAGEVVGDGDVPPPPWVLCSSYSDSEDGEEDIGFVGQLNRAGPAGDGYGSGIGSQYGSNNHYTTAESSDVRAHGAFGADESSTIAVAQNEIGKSPGIHQACTGCGRTIPTSATKATKECESNCKCHENKMNLAFVLR